MPFNSLTTAWISFWGGVREILMNPPSCGITIRFNKVINFHKGMVPIYCLLCMYYFDYWASKKNPFFFIFFLGFNWKFSFLFLATAWIYLAIHGSYGICWILKDITFGNLFI